MKKSIRMLGLTPQVRKQLEELRFFTVQQLLETDVKSVEISHEEKEKLALLLEKYRLKMVEEEVRQSRKRKSYLFLNEFYALENFPLSYRSYNALQSNNINTISELFLSVVTFDIATLEGFGSKSVVQAMEIVQQICKEQEIQEDIFAKVHPCDSLPIEVASYSNLIIQGLHGFHVFTFGDIRRKYLNGELFEYFNRKTLTSILEGYKSRIYDSELNEFLYLQHMLISKWYGAISFENLENIFPDYDKIQLIDRVKESANLVVDEEGIRLRTMKEQIDRMKIKKESKNIMHDRFSGNTLQVVADKFKKTRERIRQIVRDRVSQIEIAFEMAFVKEYNRFYWRPEIFKIVYGLSDYSFQVVKYLSDKPTPEGDYDNPVEFIDTLRENQLFPSFDDEALQIELDKTKEPTMEIDGVVYPWMTKRLFLEFVIEHFVPRTGLHKFKILDVANEVAERNEIPYRYDKFIDIVSNTIQGLQNVRYFDFSTLTEEHFKGLESILYEIDSVYSMRYFHQKYPKLMESMDIRSGYELHFVLRRYYADNPVFTEIVDFNRQPILSKKGMLIADVIIGEWSALDEAINVDLFAERLAKRYGYHLGTLVNNINATLGDYISVKTLYLFKPELTNETLDRIKPILQDDFYELEELEELFLEHGIAKSDYGYFTNFWLNQFDYKTHDINYIIKKGFSSLKEVFFGQVLANDIYTITPKDHKMRETTLILFLETLREEYLAFPSKDGNVYTMGYLKQFGVTVEELKEYVQELTKILKKKVYYTYYYLKKHNYQEQHPIFEKIEHYGLGDDIMNNLIRNVPGIKKSTKGDLFCITTGLSVVRDFVLQLSKEYHTNQITQLQSIMQEEYGISFKKSDYEGIESE